MSITKWYGLSDKFVHNMLELKWNNIKYSEVTETDIWRQYIAIDKLTNRFMKKQKVTTVIWVLLYTIFHFDKMKHAQKYYSKDFWKPCEINNNR